MYSDKKHKSHKHCLLSFSFLLHLPISLNLCSNQALDAIISSFILSCLKKLLYQVALPFFYLNRTQSDTVFHPPYMCHTAQRFLWTRASPRCTLDFFFFGLSLPHSKKKKKTMLILLLPYHMAVSPFTSVVTRM